MIEVLLEVTCLETLFTSEVEFDAEEDETTTAAKVAGLDKSETHGAGSSNEYIDNLLAMVKHEIKDKHLDPLELPDKEKSFKKVRIKYYKINVWGRKNKLISFDLFRGFGRRF